MTYVSDTKYDIIFHINLGITIAYCDFVVTSGLYPNTVPKDIELVFHSTFTMEVVLWSPFDMY